MIKLLGLTVELIRVEYSRSEIDIMHKDTIGGQTEKECIIGGIIILLIPAPTIVPFPA